MYNFPDPQARRGSIALQITSVIWPTSRGYGTRAGSTLFSQSCIIQSARWVTTEVIKMSRIHTAVLIFTLVYIELKKVSKLSSLVAPRGLIIIKVYICRDGSSSWWHVCQSHPPANRHLFTDPTHWLYLPMSRARSDRRTPETPCRGG
jgi:hypothetical protein